MAGLNLSFAKIVANPNAYSWSQVYNAGKLFAVLSLETQEEIAEKDYLKVLGKEVFDALEQEFFTLETKDLDSIKQAVLATSQKIPTDIMCSFVIGAFINNILYIYVLGNGRVSLKRGEKLGNLLEVRDQKSDSLKVASGFLQGDDIIILQTKQFSDIISIDTLSKFIGGLPLDEVAENLAPLIHEKEEAGAASIIIRYQAPEEKEEIEEEVVEEAEKPEPQEFLEEKKEITETIEEENKSPFYTPQIKEDKNSFKNIFGFLSSFSSKLRIPKSAELNHPRKVILTIAAVILIVFLGSVIFAVEKQQNQKTQALFQSIYPQAQEKYKGGLSLVGLDQGLAKDSFTQAKQILDSGKDKLPKNSPEEKQVLALLAKVDSELNAIKNTGQNSTRQVDPSVSPFLVAETKNDGIYFAKDSSNIYILSSTGISSLSTDGTNKKTIIKNSGLWQDPGGLSTYYGNIYVLDKKQNQILKFVQTTSGYSNTNYFQGTSPDLSKAVSIAIDSSIYVLTTDGKIEKFTKGTQDNFSITGLNQPLLNPTRIYTNADDNYIYVLDNGNSRIVVFDKSGNFKNQYQADIIKNSKDFEVLESDKKIYVLSSDKVYEIDLK